MHLFYQPDFTGEFIHLSEEESKHAIRVLRLSIGDQVLVVDGKGSRWVAEVSEDHPKRCVLKTVAVSVTPIRSKTHVHIAVAPTKNMERIEWFIEKATEIGIDEITLLDCEHSERTIVKKERLEKVAIAAMKQSQQAHLPVIHEMVPFNAFIKSVSADIKLIAHCDEEEKNPISEISLSGKNVLVLIGPEGDFSRAEIDTALGNQFTAVSLGETRLRTETAALYAVTAISLAQ